LFIIGVLDYWSDGPKRLFDISKLLFPILQHSSPNYCDHIQDFESSNYDRLKYKSALSKGAAGLEVEKNPPAGNPHRLAS